MDFVEVIYYFRVGVKSFGFFVRDWLIVFDGQISGYGSEGWRCSVNDFGKEGVGSFVIINIRYDLYLLLVGKQVIDVRVIVELC